MAALGSFLLILMACITLSFLVTTPGSMGAGSRRYNSRFMLGAAAVTLADSAKAYLSRSVALG